MLAVANGHELLATVTGTGCMSSAITGCFLAATRRRPLEAAAAALAAFGVAGEDAAADAKGPAPSMSASTTRSAALEPETLDARARDLVKLHASWTSWRPRGSRSRAARRSSSGASKRAAVDVVERGDAPRGASAHAHGITFVVNDDIEAALMLGADGVHLGRTDEGSAGAREPGSCSGFSASSSRKRVADAEADYIGAGPVWETPSKTDADPAIGLEGLQEICSRPRSPSSRSAASTRQTRRVHRAGAEASRSSARPAIRCVEGGDRCSLSELGELGLLAELERRGLVGESRTTPPRWSGVVVTQDALVEDVHFRLDWISWRDSACALRP